MTYHSVFPLIFADMFPFIYLSFSFSFFFFTGSAVDNTEDIMKHEDRHDKELSHPISIIKTTQTKSKKLDGVYRLSKHNEKIRVFQRF